MARSSKEQTEANRNRIVEAAGKLFRDRGFDAVGIADVMKAAGLTQGGFYRHFGSKEALFTETLIDSFGGALSQWRSSASAPQPRHELVENYFSDAPAEYRCPMLAFGEEVARTPQNSNMRDAYLEGARALHDTFVQAHSGPPRRSGDDILFAAMVGVGLLLRVGHEADWVQGMAAAVKSEASRWADNATHGPK